MTLMLDVKRDPDPAKSREHVLLSLLAERRQRAKEPSDLGALLADVTAPPLERIGALTVERFMPERQIRRARALQGSAVHG